MSKKATRLARQAELESRRARERRLRIGGLVAAVLILGGGVVWFITGQAQTTPAGATAVPDVVATEIRVPDEGRGHVDTGQTVTYNHYPPSSGAHWGSPGGPVAWGVYPDEVRPEAWLHNLEHGGIVVLYNCPEGCPDMVAALKKWQASVPNSKWGSQKVLVAPDTKIPTKIVALAWTRELDLSDFDAGRLTTFYKTWVDRGPEDVP